MIKLLRDIALISIVIVILAALGNVIDEFLPWSALTNFFVILRHFSSIFNFMWDMDTTFVLVGYMLLIEVAVWAFRAGLTVVNYFRS